MKVLIAAGGDLGDIDFISRNSPDWDFIIGVDSGADHLKALALKPHLLVGDFDSISPSLLRDYESLGVPIQSYPSKKDWTDTHLAVDIAIDKGASNIYIIGALGGRWDHSYANVMLLYGLAKKGIEAKILNSNNTLSISRDALDIQGRPGQIVSLLPFAGDAWIKSTKGLAYPADNLKMTMNYPIGISNVLVNSEARVEIESGWIMAIVAED